MWCRGRSLPEGQKLPEQADVLGTLGSASNASKADGASPRLAASSAPPVVDRTAAHPNHHSQGKALVSSASSVLGRPMRNGLPDDRCTSYLACELCSAMVYRTSFTCTAYKLTVLWPL